MSLLITGASGRLGRLAATRLVANHDPRRVVLATRTPAALADFAARGAQVREADFSRPTTLESAFDGVERLLLISTDAIGRRESQHMAAITAARNAGVSFIVYTSFPIPADAPPLIAEEHIRTESAIRASGMEWSILRDFPYAERQIPEFERAVAAGELVTNTGDGGTAFVARADCAAAASAVLGSDGHGGTTYDLTGPAALDAVALAALFTELSGKAIAVRHVDDATVAGGIATMTGMSLPVMLDVASSVGGQTRNGLYAQVSDTVERLTGRPATSLHQVLSSFITRSRG